MLAAAPFDRRRTVRFVGNQEVIPKTAYRKCGLLVTLNSRLLETCSSRKIVNISAPHGEPEESAHFGRIKVDGSLTCSPGNKLNCKLSGTGRLADLYSDFGDQRILGMLRAGTLSGDVLWYRSEPPIRSKAREKRRNMRTQVQVIDNKRLTGGEKLIRITDIGHSPAISYVFLRTLRARRAYRWANRPRSHERTTLVCHDRVARRTSQM